MSASLVLPHWLVSHPDFGDELRTHAEDMTKAQAMGFGDYAGEVEWIEHPGLYGGAPFWEVRAW